MRLIGPLPVSLTALESLEGHGTASRFFTPDRTCTMTSTYLVFFKNTFKFKYNLITEKCINCKYLGMNFRKMNTSLHAC